MLKNAPTLAIVAVDTDENGPLNIWGPNFHNDIVMKFQSDPPDLPAFVLEGHDRRARVEAHVLPQAVEALPKESIEKMK